MPTVPFPRYWQSEVQRLGSYGSCRAVRAPPRDAKGDAHLQVRAARLKHSLQPRGEGHGERSERSLGKRQEILVSDEGMIDALGGTGQEDLIVASEKELAFLVDVG